jgi:hypothetical protein
MGEYNGYCQGQADQVHLRLASFELSPRSRSIKPLHLLLMQLSFLQHYHKLSTFKRIYELLTVVKVDQVLMLLFWASPPDFVGGSIVILRLKDVCVHARGQRWE